MTVEQSTDRRKMGVFHQLLINSLANGVTGTFLWFAVTFWVYLETESVTATAVIAGAFGISSALLGIVFGTFVDRHRKHTVMMISSGSAVVSYVLAAVVYSISDPDDLLRLSSPWFWVFISLILLGSVAGNMRAIALSTCVTLLVPEHQRDRANGMVGTVTGVSFAITSVFSGLVVGQLGMGWALGIALVITVLVVVHLLTIFIPEADPEPADPDAPRWVDFGGAIRAIGLTPGLMALILFTAFNNLLGGVFMALMDAYGLSLVSVEAWGFLWGILSFGFIIGGLIVARRGLGPQPLRVILVANFVCWTVCSVFTLRSSIVLLGVGAMIWITLMPIIEAAEQTVLQRSVPFQQQGRVFGFAQTVESATTPITALLIGPLTEVVFIPFMTTGGGVDSIGGWFGTGKERGIALVFTIAGLIGMAVTIAARFSRWYRELSSAYAETTFDDDTVDPKVDAQVNSPR